jgi:hypothetical protein
MMIVEMTSDHIVPVQTDPDYGHLGGAVFVDRRQVAGRAALYQIPYFLGYLHLASLQMPRAVLLHLTVN